MRPGEKHKASGCLSCKGVSRDSSLSHRSKETSVSEGYLEHMWESPSLRRSFSHSLTQFTELPVYALPEDGHLGSAHVIIYHRLLEPVTGQGLGRGNLRSINNLNIFSYLSNLKERLLHYWCKESIGWKYIFGDKANDSIWSIPESQAEMLRIIYYKKLRL